MQYTINFFGMTTLVHSSSMCVCVAFHRSFNDEISHLPTQNKCIIHQEIETAVYRTILMKNSFRLSRFDAQSK